MQEKDGWNSLFLNCHDQPRSVSRFGDDKKYWDRSAKMLATTIHMLRGTPYIYQGEEIGMTNAYFKNIDYYRDIESINYYHILKEEGIEEEKIMEILQSKSRDNARTPMQWDENGSFTNGVPWIRMNENHDKINVKNQMQDPDSILNYYRKLISLRKEYEVISHGSYEEFPVEYDDVFAYKRTAEHEELLVICNLDEGGFKVELADHEDWKILICNYEDINLDNTINIRPYESLVLYKSNKKEYTGDKTV